MCLTLGQKMINRPHNCWTSLCLSSVCLSTCLLTLGSIPHPYPALFCTHGWPLQGKYPRSPCPFWFLITMGQWEALALGAGQEKERRQNISSPLSAVEWFLRQRLHLFLDSSSCLLDFPPRIQVSISNPEHLPPCSAALEVLVASCSILL